MKVLAIIMVTLVSVFAQAQYRYGYQAYGARQGKWALPPNNLHLKDNPTRAANITEEKFNQIVDDAMKYWIPIAKAKGVELVASKDWKDSTVNAYANQSGKTWTVAMFGGLARRPEVTEDGFALVVCHELGHHFGGYSFYGKAEWASAEGESDFFATNVCAKVIWGMESQRNMAFRGLRNVPPTVKTACDTVWNGNTNAQGWCVRAAAAGSSLANLLAALGGDPAPKFETPDATVVKKTNTAHPRAQCRLDTYFSGALCTKKWDMNVIPAKGFPQGQDTAGAELEAMKYSCFQKEGFKVGVRPNCWFKSLN